MKVKVKKKKKKKQVLRLALHTMHFLLPLRRIQTPRGTEKWETDRMVRFGACGSGASNGLVHDDGRVRAFFSGREPKLKELRTSRR